MVQSSVSISEAATPYSSEAINPKQRVSAAYPAGRRNKWLDGIQRRLRRRRRRRKVGRAYDMALEIARVLPANARVLDVGCGSGFIAHHLSTMVGTNVVGIDLDATPEAAIDYRQFDGRRIPLADDSVDAVLLCYVLHHAQDVNMIMNELRRVLSSGGQAIVYEDIPAVSWDSLVCWMHNLKWRNRTGSCTFRLESEWRTLFNSKGFEVVSERRLSRWRNFSHPVRRQLFVIKAEAKD